MTVYDEESYNSVLNSYGVLSDDVFDEIKTYILDSYPSISAAIDEDILSEDEFNDSIAEYIREEIYPFVINYNYEFDIVDEILSYTEDHDMKFSRLNDNYEELFYDDSDRLDYDDDDDDSWR